MKHRKMIGVVLSSAALLALGNTATAETVPEAHIASPEVYKVLAENEQLRVILATWQPGQKDVMHSHPMLAAYSLTDCRFRIHKADGTTVEKSFKAHDGARVKVPTHKHAFENITNQQCQTLLVERKN